jgi:hypothetical protein
VKLSLRTSCLLTASASLALSASACNFQLGSSTSGTDTGRVQFSYESGDCFFGCSMRPMMVGTTESVNAQLSSLAAGATVAADDPTVLSVSLVSTTCCTSSSCSTAPSDACASGQRQSLSFEVGALRTGSTKVRVMAGTKELDGIVLSVATPDRIALRCGGGSTSNLSVGSTCAIDWTVWNPSGGELQASQGVSLTVADPSVAGIEGWGGLVSSVSDASIGFLASWELQGVAPGNTTLVGSVGGVSSEIAVDVSAK